MSARTPRDTYKGVNRPDRCWECGAARPYLVSVGLESLDEERPVEARRCLLCTGRGDVPVVVRRNQVACLRMVRRGSGEGVRE